MSYTTLPVVAMDLSRHTVNKHAVQNSKFKTKTIVLLNLLKADIFHSGNNLINRSQIHLFLVSWVFKLCMGHR